MNPRSELEFCRQHGITVIWLDDIWRDGVDAAIARAVEVAYTDTDGVYLSVDVDSLDAAFAPGTCVPTPGGLTTRELLELVRGVAANKLVGVDVVEAAPSLDPTSTTSGIGCRIAIDAMAYHAGAGASRDGASSAVVGATT
jgi:arginase family enzyme